MQKVFLAFLLAASVTACGKPPNLKSASDYNSPPPPPINHPLYNPYAAYGEARATWRPPIVDRDGNIQKPYDPSTAAGRPNYELAPWATGAGRSPFSAPAGTF